MTKIFTIGDSISQGFMSGSAANTRLSYSTLLAEALGETNYRYYRWDERYKTKIDLERIFRALERKFGSNIRGLEWLNAFSVINGVLDQAEDYYERGEGMPGLPVGSPFDSTGFHNVAVEGMDVGDAFMVTPQSCLDAIAKGDASGDGYLHAVGNPFSRNAYRILNPLGDKGMAEFGNFTAVDWLKRCAKEEGVENLFLWLGANNALGTVLSLSIQQTPNDPERVLKASREERSKWNLWHPNDFKAEYTALLDKVVDAMQENKEADWKVFVGTVPLVTIAPIAKGMGEKRVITDPSRPEKKALYYEFYSYFPLSDSAAKDCGKYLPFRDALFIDKTIVEFNRIITTLVAKKNKDLGREHFHIVDIGRDLTDMAWKRNFGEPSYPFPEALQFIYPPIDTKYYDTSPDGDIASGGIFSLDGVHPTAIGQGIIAEEFLKAVKEARPEENVKSLDWQKIIASDSLRAKPITLMRELYEHDKLVKFICSVGDIINLKD
ncbi:hypothetical protein BM528_02615 [Alteromonas sp. RW2A1]|uniref:hypothetical protein n=1 Tax=Alteromonas sp. RW2A1 TaxID=1917158 RepID=UPI0009031BD8|nr:hypothetical protein [Alteromonas sp. RW2A1]APE04798.1 hypothetical protein BM528_02615 [Alteromonas sp. RW2A1]